MIAVAVVAVAAIAALLFLLLRAYSQIDDLLDRIQAPELVVQRNVLETSERPNLDPIAADMGPWATPPPPEDEE